MNRRQPMILAAALILIFGCVAERVSKTVDVPRITKEQLKSILRSQDVVIIDVRTKQQWRYSNRKIPGAVYENANNVESWVDKYPNDKTVVLY